MVVQSTGYCDANNACLRCRDTMLHSINSPTCHNGNRNSGANFIGEIMRKSLPRTFTVNTSE